MATNVLMPKLGLTMEEGTITKWNFAQGAEVKTGDVLYELETDKMSNEVVCETDGVLHILYPEGSVVPVVETVAVITAPGEAPPAATEAPGTTEAEAPSADAPPAQSAPQQAAPAGGRIWATPKAKALAKERGVDLTGIAASRADGLVTAKDLAAAPAVKASPMAVKTAAAAGVELASIQKEGRIMKQDVLDAIPGAPAAACAPARRVRMSAMRKAIARNMSSSWATAPTVTYEMQADVGEMAALKETLSKTGKKISYTDILIKMIAGVLTEFPMVGSSIEGDELILHQSVHMGVAVALEEGLVVPVIRDAQAKGIGEISDAVKGLSAKAREGRLTADEMRGATFTVTNLGMFGVQAFSPIVNLPESAILGVCAIVDTPVVREGQVVVRPMMNLCLTADHRAVDGAVGARFLARVKEVIENPWQMLL